MKIIHPSIPGIARTGEREALPHTQPKLGGSPRQLRPCSIPIVRASIRSAPWWGRVESRAEGLNRSWRGQRKKTACECRPRHPILFFLWKGRKARAETTISGHLSPPISHTVARANSCPTQWGHCRGAQRGGLPASRRAAQRLGAKRNFTRACRPPSIQLSRTHTQHTFSGKDGA